MSKSGKWILILVALLSVATGAYLTYDGLIYVTTDNAQVSARVAMLSSRVGGTVQKVYVDDNQHVDAGAPLVQIDEQDFANATETAQAQLDGLTARLGEARREYRRASQLFKTQAISNESFDKAKVSLLDLGSQVKAAKAQFGQAQLNRGYTRIVAPYSGMIARKSVEAGQYVSVGQPLLGFVMDEDRWVVANLKETQLIDIHPGMPVVITVDSLPGRSFAGQVESIGPSTGAIFSLLPPDNATGNFTKVVQRVPVKIKLLKLSKDDVGLLRPGLSAYVSIRVR